MTVVTVHHAKTHLSKLIAAAERGEEVVIARGTKPVIKLVRIASDAPRPQRQFGAYKGVVGFDESFFDPMDEEDLRLWEGRGEGED